MKKVMWSIVIFILNSVILIYIYKECMQLTFELNKKEIQPMSIKTYTVDIGKIRGYVCYQGRIEKEKVFLVPQISSKVTQIYVEEGEYVEAGKKLISFDTRELEEELDKIDEVIKQFKRLEEALGTKTQETEEMIKKLNRQIEEIEIHLDKLYHEQSSIYADKPYKKNIIALEEEINALKTLKKTLEIVHPKAEDSNRSIAFLEEIHNNLISLKSNYEILSPISGRIEKMNSQVGEIPSVFAPVLSVVNDEKQKLIINLPKSYRDEHDVGDLCEVEIVDAKMESYKIKGQIAKMMSQEALDTMCTVVMTLQVPDEMALEGIYGKIELPLEISDTIVIPKEALIRTKSKDYVYVLEEKMPYRIKKCVLKLGLENNRQAEVLEGLSKGEEIVLDFMYFPSCVILHQ